MILEEQEGKIYFIKEAKSIPEVVSLYKNNKEEFVLKAIEYVYWMYSENSVYREMLPSQRKSYICKRHLGGDEAELYEENKEVKALIKLYDEIQLSREERLRVQIQRDMDDLLVRLGNIKFTKEVMVDIEGTTKEGLTVKKKALVEMDNSKEKAETLAISKTLILLSKELETLIKANSKNKKIEQKRRLFDNIPKKIKK